MLKKKKNKNMVYYGMSIVGTSHVKKGTVCQDSHKAVVLVNGWCVAAVADGVGSAKHSEVASSIAVKTAVDYCETHIKNETNIEELEGTLKVAYEAAEKAIQDYVAEQGDSITDYDTTLSMVVYDGKTIIYGHSGDGGIVGLLNDGLYVKITNPQKAEDGICVIPLRAGETHWEFGTAEGEFASVLLATDGVYDTFFPYLLKGQKNEVYVPLIQYFLDNNALDITSDNSEEIKQSRVDFLNSAVYEPVTDDKTVLVIVNPTVKPAFQDEDYYKDPDWEALQLEWNKKAYPHLYKDKE